MGNGNAVGLQNGEAGVASMALGGGDSDEARMITSGSLASTALMADAAVIVDCKLHNLF